MYLIFSTAAVFAALIAAVCESTRAKRLRRELWTKTAEAESFECASKSVERALSAEQSLHRRTRERCGKLETALRDSEDTVCRLRQQLQTAREELTLSEEEHDGCTRKLTDALNEIERLKKDRHALEVAVISQEECAAHWKEEYDWQVRYRLADQGRIYREISNILAYDGTSAGQEDLND